MTRRKRAIDEHYVRKASDETIDTSTTLQDDDELLFPVGANETWAFTIWLRYVSGATPDIKFTITVPSGASGDFRLIGRDSTGSAIAASQAAGATEVAFGAVSRETAIMQGTVRTGATPGNVTLQWAQNTSDGGNTTVEADSVLMAWRVD